VTNELLILTFFLFEKVKRNRQKRIHDLIFLEQSRPCILGRHLMITLLLFGEASVPDGEVEGIRHLLGNALLAGLLRS